MPITLTTTLASSGTATFEVYSPFGAGANGPIGDNTIGDSPGKEISDGDLIEVVQYTAVPLYIINVSGLSQTDLRKISFETDYGERYEAEFIDDAALPTNVRTMASSGKTLGLYPGYVPGHTFRGTTMAGAQQLTSSYAGDGGGVGTCDRTVTVTVSDGVNSGSMSFTVRVFHPDIYYTDATKATNAFTGSSTENRRGCIYVSRDGDFTGAPTGTNIYHYTIPSGDVGGRYVFRQGGANAGAKDIVDTGTSTSLTDFSWNSDDNTMAVFLRGDETYFFEETCYIQRGLNNLMASWGTGRATISMEKLTSFGCGGDAVISTAIARGRNEWIGSRFHNLKFHCSDFSPDDVTWREWWNILPYSSTSGTIAENTTANVHENGYNGTVLTNGSGVYTQVIQNDTANSRLLVRHIVSGSWAGTSPEATFSGGDVLEDVNNASNTVTLETDLALREGRQGRPKLHPVTFFTGAAGVDSEGMTLDNCEMQGPKTAFENLCNWLTLSDTIIRNYCDYALFGQPFHQRHIALVVTQPDGYIGGKRVMGSSVSVNRYSFNVVLSGDPTEPAENNITHAAFRLGHADTFWTYGQYKVLMFTYGGHVGTTGGAHQSMHRWMNTEPTEGDTAYIYQYGCTWSGGNLTFASHPVDTFPPKAWVQDTCWHRGAFCNGGLFQMLRHNTRFVNCKFGWPSDVTLASQLANDDPSFVEWKDAEDSSTGSTRTTPWTGETSDNASEFEDCTFEYQASGRTGGNLLALPTSGRTLTISYTNNTYDVDATDFDSVAAEYT